MTRYGIALFSLVAAGLLAGCHSHHHLGSYDGMTSHHESNIEQQSIDWVGTYHGQLPCADCEGIDTHLQLNRDGSYVLKEHYMGKRGAVFQSRGKYVYIPKQHLIQLDASADKQAYVWMENRLHRANEHNRPITGPLAEQYILEKINRY